MSLSNREKVYAVLAIIGAIATWSFNLLFIDQYGGFEPGLFVSENYVNYASASISNDIIVVCIAFLFWSYTEAKRLGMQRWWVYIPLTFLVAIAFAMPLFLMMREKRLRQLSNEHSGK